MLKSAMDITEPTSIDKDIAFQAAPSKQQFEQHLDEEETSEQELLKTKSQLEQAHENWTVSDPKYGRLRIKNNENNTFNYSDENGQLLSPEEWFLDASDFEEVNGQKVALVWVPYSDNDNFGKELKRIRPDGTFVEKPGDITMKLLEEGFSPNVLEQIFKDLKQIDSKNPNKIKKISDIIIGERYIEMRQGKKTGITVKILADPYQDKDGNWWVESEEIFEDGYTFKREISLADRGVVPYSSNWWNPVNSLVKENETENKS
jgi:hypothetical protein